MAALQSRSKHPERPAERSWRIRTLSANLGSETAKRNTRDWLKRIYSAANDLELAGECERSNHRAERQTWNRTITSERLAGYLSELGGNSELSKFHRHRSSDINLLQRDGRRANSFHPLERIQKTAKDLLDESIRRLDIPSQSTRYGPNRIRSRCQHSHRRRINK